MTDHDIPELERQYEAARQRASQAEEARNAAHDRLMKARIAKMLADYAAQGITPGTLVMVRQPMWGGGVDGVKGPYAFGGVDGSMATI